MDLAANGAWRRIIRDLLAAPAGDADARQTKYLATRRYASLGRIQRRHPSGHAIRYCWTTTSSSMCRC